MAQTISLGEVARLAGGTLQGDATLEILSVAPMSTAGAGDLTWLADRKHIRQLPGCRATAVLILPGVASNGLPAVICERPDLAIARVLQHLQPPLPHPASGVDPHAWLADPVCLGSDVAIGPGAVIQAHAVIGPRCIIHSGVFIGEHCELGSDCLVWPNAVIRERTVIGDRVIVHPNATIGADGFGYNFDQGHYQKIAHIGRVRIGDDVEIGANTCIDRAKCGETVIGRGTKIDNLVQVAHNVKIGEDCCIIAHVGIAGSTEVGRRVILAGKAGLKDNIKVGDDAQIAACTCISGDVADGEIMLGIPGKPKVEFFRERLSLRHLPEALAQIRALTKRVEQLEAANHSQNG